MLEQYKILNHTPGPWTLGTSTSANPHGDFEVFGADYGFYTTGRVAVVDRRAANADSVKSFSPQTQRLTAEANARLIAAAPELFEALRGAVAYAEMGGGFIESPYWYTAAKCVLEKIDQA